MHVGGVEIVLLVPGRGRQHDVGIDAGRGHAEIERHQQIEFSFRRLARATPLPAAWRGPPRRGFSPARHATCRADVLRNIRGPCPTSRAGWSARRTGCAASSSDCPGPRRTFSTRPKPAPARRNPSAPGPARPPSPRIVSGFCSSCGAEGSQPMRSARTL